MANTLSLNTTIRNKTVLEDAYLGLNAFLSKNGQKLWKKYES